MKIPSPWVRSLCLLAAALSSFAAEDRVLQKVDRSRTVALQGFVHAKALRQADLGLVAETEQLGHVLLMLRPSGDLEAFLREQLSPGSPNYHKWLQPEQFAERFGASPNDVAKAVQWLQTEGLQVDTVARGRQFVSFHGSVGAVARAFRTEFHKYDDNGRTRFANSREPSVPLAMDSLVAGVRGFNNFGLKPLHRQARLQPNFTTASGNHYLSPGDIATIFNFLPLYAAGINGTGQSVAVIGQTNVDISDIRAFRAAYRLPPGDPEIQLFGPNPGVSPDDQYEAHLDLEWAGAAAPNARIIYVNSTDVILSTYYAVDNNVSPVISMSYGGCEVENTPDIRFLGQQANAQGITWVVASGDSGAAGCDFSAPGPQATKGRVAGFPASLPEVTAIGGTTLNEGTGKYWAATNKPDGSSALSYIPEIAWNDTPLRNEMTATGGGASVFYSKPWWQAGKGVPDDGARDIPDVSFPASADHDGYLVFSGGAQYIFGGTSVGTPIFAGVLALVNQSLVNAGKLVEPGLGNVNPALYRLAQASTSVYHDITAGDNVVPCSQGSPDCVDGKLGYTAGPGYDLTTGLGSPDVTALVRQWNLGVVSSTTLSAKPSSAALNDNITLTAVVRSTGSSRPTGTVTFLSSYNQLATVSLTPGPGTTAIATLVISMVRIAEGTGSVSAIYAGDGVVDGSGGSSFLELIIPASGSLVIPSVDPNPVYQFGASYVFTVTLQEAAGVSTRITGFTFDGANVALTVLGQTNLPAFGFIQAILTSASGINPTAGTHVFTFSGSDANGRTWSQSVTAVFLPSASPALTPSILLTSVPRTVNRNPNAEPNCQWAQQFTVQEQGGFLTNLTGFAVGNSSQSGLIQQIFGTTRLAPWGVLYGTQCYSTNTVASNRTFTIAGVGEIGSVSSVTSVTYSQTAPVAAAALSLSRPSLVFTLPEAGPTRTAPIDITLTGGQAVWSVSKLPDNLTTKWLSVLNTSGEGPGRFTVQATSAGLSRGVYRAFITVQAANAFPQAINLPVTLVVGASPVLSIAGVSNAASFGPTGAPGGQMRVLGLNLAPSSAIANRFPLPVSLEGVSVTVNGVSAPLYSVAPERLEIQVPYETALGTAVLAVNRNGQIAWQEFPVATTAPGIFATSRRFLTPTSVASPGQTISAYLTGDGDVSPTLATGDTPAQGTIVTRLPRPRLPVSVTVGGIQAFVRFVGITPGVAGVTQLNFTVPDSVPPGTQPVVVSVGGVNSPPVNLQVQYLQVQ
ncbi:MAG: peptidase S8 [Acidobacteriia bacterium]|nr:peptidase S8 [Terriglobia bacterium]